LPHHNLDAGADTVHWGYFDADEAPVLTVASGDTVTVTTVSGASEVLPADGSGLDVLPEHRAVLAAHAPTIGPHIMTGPVFVEGAEPGDVLEVRIREVELRQNWGYNVIRPLWGTIPEDFGDTRRTTHIPIDIAAGTASPPWGGTLRLAPFFGNIGVAPPPAWSRVTSTVPRDFGGNLDNKELVAGSTLFLPVFNRGALFSVGDGHGLQGDGEVNVSAVETALRGTFELIVRKDMKLRRPRAETPTHFITMGFDVDLDTAAKDAVRDMIVLIGEKKGLSREDAYALMSLACDLRVTQMVNISRGVHAMLARSVLDF
jgi:acetamidase/formamidase